MNTPLKVGDAVDVLRACRLPKADVLGSGTVERIEGDLYWISGFPCARSQRELRRSAPNLMAALRDALAQLKE